MLAGFLPSIFLTPPASHVADRHCCFLSAASMSGQTEPLSHKSKLEFSYESAFFKGRLVGNRSYVFA